MTPKQRAAAVPWGMYTPATFAAVLEEVIAAAEADVREECAALAEAMAERHRDHCRPECRCADGWHVAAAIRRMGGHTA